MLDAKLARMSSKIIVAMANTIESDCIWPRRQASVERRRGHVETKGDADWLSQKHALLEVISYLAMRLDQNLRHGGVGTHVFYKIFCVILKDQEQTEAVNAKCMAMIAL